MKTITAAMLILLTSCVSDSNPTDKIKKITYEGHSYLLYREINPHSSYSGMCHDENCDCLKK